ncbi:MAG: FAD/NAD(P)-binding oxidoreductase [Salinibacter sp.]|uniref:FAD/NAD(P)-binding oxidoreductase n=1 Tax=Salinibacter sp. TaxID=2065818 RepID=UPI002FC35ADE
MTAKEEPLFPIVVLGGGAAGSAVLNALGDAGLAADTALVEPSPYHYDQPEWVRVGTEGRDKADTRSPRHANIPSATTWIQKSATGIQPDEQIVNMDDGTAVRYEHLVVALGIETLWDRIRGLKSSLGDQGVCSVYGYEQAERTWEMIRSFSGGRAIFTAPSTPHKGGGAPLQILRRAESLWRDTGTRAQTELVFAVAAPTGLKEGAYDDLSRDGDKDDVHVYTGYDLIEVRHEAQEAVFSVTKGRSQTRQVLPYDLLHVVPPMRPPALLEESGLAHRDGPMKGYMEMRPESFQHARFATVFGVGDALGVEGEKTGERAREQAASVAQALLRLRAPNK